MLKIYFIVIILFAIGYGFVRWSVTPELKRFIGPRFVACYVLIVFAATYAPNATIYGLVCMVVFMGAVRGRLDALCLLTMLGILAPAVNASVVIGSLFLLQTGTAQFLTLACALALIWQKRDSAKPVRGFTVEDVIAITLFLAFWIGVNRFPSLSGSLRAGTAATLTNPLPYLLFRHNLRTPREVSLVAACSTIAAILSAVVAGYENRTSWLPINLLASHLSTAEYGLSLLFRGNLLRPLAATGNALVLAAVFVSGFVASACSRHYLRSGVIYALWLALLVLGLVVAQSRGNLLALALVCVLLLGLSGRKILAASIAALALVIYETLVMLSSSSAQISAFLGINNSADTNFDGHYDYRGLLLQRGLQEAAKHRWFGTSMENVLGNLQDLIQGQHIIDFVNTYLVIYLVSGLVGITILIGAMVLLLIKLVALKTKRFPDIRPARAFVLVAFVAMAVELSFMSYIGCIPFLLMLILAGSRTVRLEYRNRAQPARRLPTSATVLEN